MQTDPIIIKKGGGGWVRNQSLENTTKPLHENHIPLDPLTLRIYIRRHLSSLCSRCFFVFPKHRVCLLLMGKFPSPFSLPQRKWSSLPLSLSLFQKHTHTKLHDFPAYSVKPHMVLMGLFFLLDLYYYNLIVILMPFF